MRRTGAVLLTVGLIGSATAVMSAPMMSRASSALDRVQDIERGVLVTLDSGTRLRIRTSPNHRRTTIQRAEPGAAWSAKRRLVRDRRLYCGDVKAATSGQAVALTVLCDKGGYAEDQAPVRSQGMVSTDGGLTWITRRLPGEGYEEPGISPGGRAAVWPLGQGTFLAWQAESSYRVDQVPAPNQEYTETAVVTDTGVVTYAYGVTVADDRCGLAFVSKAPGGTESRQELAFPTDVGCGDSSLASLDVNTIEYGADESKVLRWEVTRADPTAPWAITTIAPASAPGLVQVDGGLYTQYLSGTPLVAVSAQDRRRVVTQVYDAIAQQWAAPTTAYISSVPCRWHPDGNLTSPAYVVLLKCGTRTVALSSLDGLSWQAHPGVRTALGVSRDQRYAAVATRDQVVVLSRELGRFTLPYGVTRPCDLVVPAGPDTAGRLTTKAGRRGWPARVLTSGASGWKAPQRVTLPTPPARCRHISAQGDDASTYFVSGAAYSGYALTLRKVDSRWRAKVVPF